MRKQKHSHHQTRETLLVKLFFILSVLAVTIIIGGYYWHFIGFTNRAISVPAETMAEQTTLPSGPVYVPILPSGQISACGVSMVLPEINIDSIVDNDDENVSEPGVCSFVSDPLRRFRVLVVDTSVATSSYWQDKKLAFERYLGTSLAAEIKNIATTDIFSTKISNRILHDRLAPNSIGYTAEISQDVPGHGVYQTATYIDHRLIVYLTYDLFGNSEDAWSIYFAKNYVAGADDGNASELFKKYMKMYAARPDVAMLIDAVNTSAKSIVAK